MHITLAELAQLLDGTLVAGDPECAVTGFASLKEAQQYTSMPS